jgi:hypothetical protein
LVPRHILAHGFLYAAIFNGYILLMMVTTSPRVWGYSDYPEKIKTKVPAQTREERRKAIIWSIPLLVFALGFPIYSTYLLKSNLGGEISLWAAYLNVLVMALLAYLGDLLILDWLIISKITPKFVIIDGTEEADYKDFSHHYKAQLLAAPILALLCLGLAAIVTYL